MTKEAFFQLTDKVKEGTANDAELELYNQYFNYFQVLEAWDEETMGVEDVRGQLLYESIDRAIGAPVPVRKLNTGWKKFVTVAAAVLLLAGSAVFFVYQQGQPAEQILSSINVASASTNDLIQLPDGSTVILSAGSQLKYASSFEGKAVREVFLTGKAFFDVKHRSNQPFIVRTGKVNTQVLGTAFDVDSRNERITVTVIRGKVVVNKGGQTLGTLTPNKQVVYNIAADQATLHDTDAEKTVAWREQDLVFKDITFDNAAVLLQERFDVKVIIGDKRLGQQHFTTTLFENQSLEDFLTLICDFNNAVYQYDEITKHVTIKPKN
ncbi:putative anti-sigma factor [Pedobacter sp. BAL39]|uniref:FecR family protein n=1 Tax=Pedobacter sp. BAL39 TaxID=391596 RepID=UPI000155937E|nr:FecR domain-containing protein [Pedobacter sp. BAL39]EDM38813.1 putative anti-sigma factor [Pedobacter sp. BAL39]